MNTQLPTLFPRILNYPINYFNKHGNLLNQKFFIHNLNFDESAERLLQSLGCSTNKLNYPSNIRRKFITLREYSSLFRRIYRFISKWFFIKPISKFYLK